MDRITRLLQHVYRIVLAGFCDLCPMSWRWQQRLIRHYNRLFGKHGRWIPYDEYDYWSSLGCRNLLRYVLRHYHAEIGEGLVMAGILVMVLCFVGTSFWHPIFTTIQIFLRCWPWYLGGYVVTFGGALLIRWTPKQE